MTLRDAWLILGVVATLAAFAVAWAILTARVALKSRRSLVRGVRSLGEGDTGCRLDEQEVGVATAREFDQAARNIGERFDSLGRALEHLREMGSALPGRVLIELDDSDEVCEVLGDAQALLNGSRRMLLGRAARTLFAAEDDWVALKGNGDVLSTGEPFPRRELALRKLGGELSMCEVRLLPSRFGSFILDLALPAVAAAPALDDVATPGAGTEEAPVEPVADRSPASEPPPGQTPVEVEAAAGPPAPAGSGPDGAFPAEERLEALTSALPDAVVLLVDGSIVSANPRMGTLLGMEPGELHGRLLTEFVAPADTVRALGLAADGGPAGCEVMLRRADGSDVRVDVRAGSGRAAGLTFRVLVARDVSDFRESEERIALYGAWLGAALEAHQEGVLVLAQGGNGLWPVALANSSLARLLDLQPGHLPTREEIEAAFNRFSEPDMLRAFVHGFENDGVEADGEGTFELAGDPPRTIRFQATPVRDAQRGVVGRLLTVRDVTREQALKASLEDEARRLQVSLDELKRTHGELARSSEDLEAQVEKLETTRKELAELDEMKTNLLGNVSHELQTPLVSIKGYTEMMLRGDLGDISADQRQGLEVCHRNIKRLINIIEQLLMLSRTEEKLTDLTLEEFPLWAVLDETISLLGDRIRARDLRVTTRYDTDRLTVLADRNLISQVFINIIGNAVKYNRDGGDVAISVRRGASDELVVEVKDSGIGIPREEQQRIFERGYRASTAGGTRGSGIGLALVREILERHGCQIRVDSREEEGSTFSITLPLAPPGEAAGRGMAPAGDPSASTG